MTASFVRGDSMAVPYFQYSAEKHVLFVVWSGGNAGIYTDVPPHTFRALVGAGSRGHFINEEIKPFFKYTAVDVADLATRVAVAAEVEAGRAVAVKVQPLMYPPYPAGARQ